jgi:hypothetical protein
MNVLLIDQSATLLPKSSRQGKHMLYNNGSSPAVYGGICILFHRKRIPSKSTSSSSSSSKESIGAIVVAAEKNYI